MKSNITQPTREAATVIRSVQQAERPTFASLTAILGAPDRDIGSGIFILVYDLSDGTKITVGTPDKKSVISVYHDNMQIYKKEAEQGVDGKPPEAAQPPN